MRRGVATICLLLSACTSEPRDELVPVTAEDDVLDGKSDDADSVRVELKVTLPAEQTARARRAFRLRDDRAERRAIWFFDTEALALLDGGIVLRARSIDGEDDDSTVKVRPLSAQDVEASLWALDGFKCEIDRLPDRSVESCSLTAEQDEGEIEEVGQGERDVDKLFTDEQEDFLDRHGPLSIDLDELLALGPTDALVWAVRSRTLDRTVKLELWTLADGSTVLEVSTKVAPDEADGALAELLDYLADRLLDVASTQETKTRAALERLVEARSPSD